jgi:mannose-6-phosphate isomerase-like protein (cupin superfamily)
MGDDQLIEELYRRFHSASQEVFADRIAHLRIDDLGFRDAAGTSSANTKHLVRGDDRSGASFDIFRLGWFGGRVWEMVIIDGAYLPHLHQKIDSEFVILAGRGHLSRDAEWMPYQETSRLSVGRGVAHGFITDPELGPTVFLSIQSEPIRKISIDPITQLEQFDDDFAYVDEAFSLPHDLLTIREQKLAGRSGTGRPSLGVGEVENPVQPLGEPSRYP